MKNLKKKLRSTALEVIWTNEEAPDNFCRQQVNLLHISQKLTK
jgi:hypothetical protein